MELVAQLAAGIAHDLKNLSAVVAGNCELLLTGELAPGARSGVERMRIAAMHSSDLVDRLLSFCREEPIAQSPTNIDSLIASMEPLLHCLVPRNLEFKMELDAAGAHSTIAPMFLEQVVLNLVFNARDAVSRPGEIRIHTSTVHVVCPGPETLASGDYVLVEVSDTGCGIDGEACRHVFKPFYSTKPKGKSSGLGLTLVRQAVRKCGGEVQITSTPGKGTRVLVFLPKTAAVEQSENSQSSRSAARDHEHGGENDLRRAGYSVSVSRVQQGLGYGW